MQMLQSDWLSSLILIVGNITRLLNERLKEVRALTIEGLQNRKEKKSGSAGWKIPASLFSDSQNKGVTVNLLVILGSQCSPILFLCLANLFNQAK